ncbi:MAG: nucleotidyltransferase domain-containing protein [Candidatus Pacearchaeota archaeon]|jgi:predicted nucleotidyltransferase
MLKEYSFYFVAYLFNNLGKEKENIEQIILFGSVARGDAIKESDVDIFIEIKKKTKQFEEKIKNIEQDFYKSREASLFRLKGIENRFSIKIGKIKEWKYLERSIASTGIVLYGNYKIESFPSKVKHFFIIFWNKTGKNRGAFLNKLYGFNVNGKHYEGLVSEFEGKKLGKSCIMIPIEHKKDILKLIENYKIEAKIIEVFS